MDYMSFQIRIASRAATPKSGKPYAFTPFTVEVPSIGEDDVALIATGTPAWSRSALTVRYVQYGEWVYRRIEDGNEHGPEAEVATGGHNSAIHEAAVAQALNRGALYDPDTRKAVTDPAWRHLAETATVKAANDSLIVEGKLYRKFHEPTWIVTKDRTYGNDVVLLQPFFGCPAHVIDASWFRADRKEDAETFACEMAGDRGMVISGNLDLNPFYAPGFDDVRHSLRNAVTAVGKGIPLIAVNEPRLAAEAMSLLADPELERSYFLCKDVLDRTRQVPGMDFDRFRAAVKWTMDHAAFMERFMDLSIEDERELDRMLRS